MSPIKRKFSVILLFLLPFTPICLLAQDDKIKQLQTEFEHAEEDSLKVITLIKLSREVHHQKLEVENEYNIAQKAVNMALNINDITLYARALDNLGLLYRFDKHYGQSLPLHIRAYDLVENKNNVKPIYKMRFANNAGVAARYAQQYDLAVEYYLKSLKIAEEEKNVKNIAISSNGLGNTLDNIPGREQEAFGYFINSLNAEKSENDSLGMAMDYLSISGYFIDNQNYKTALHYLDTLYDINLKRNDKFGLAITNQFYGKAYFKQGEKIDLAKTYYLKALNQFKDLKDYPHEADLLKDLGDFNQKNGNYKRGAYYYKASLKLADSLGYKTLISKNSYTLAKIEEQRGNYLTAFNYYKKGKAYEDSIALDDQRVKIAALTNTYELNQKETKIRFLQNENILKEELVANQEKEIRLHRIYFMILISGIILILLFIFIQYQTRKSKKKTEDLLQKNREELLTARYEKSIAQAEIIVARTQLNPHFLFNCLTGIHLMIQKNETKKADRYLINLSRFLRMILEIPKNEFISLEEEINLIEYYVTLEEKRFDNDFCFNLKTLERQTMKAIKLPPLLLQPFVENAIWHGLLPSAKTDKKLNIIIEQSSKVVTIIIEDNGVGRVENLYQNKQFNKNKSLGTKITQERIAQFNKSYDTNIEVEIIDKKDKISGQNLGTKVVLTLTHWQSKLEDKTLTNK